MQITPKHIPFDLIKGKQLHPGQQIGTAPLPKELEPLAEQAIKFLFGSKDMLANLLFESEKPIAGKTAFYGKDLPTVLSKSPAKERGAIAIGLLAWAKKHTPERPGAPIKIPSFDYFISTKSAEFVGRLKKVAQNNNPEELLRPAAPQAHERISYHGPTRPATHPDYVRSNPAVSSSKAGALNRIADYSRLIEIALKGELLDNEYSAVLADTKKFAQEQRLLGAEA